MKCRLDIIGVQTDADGAETRIEFTAAAKRYAKNGVDYLTYQETEASGMAGTTTLLKLYGDYLVLVRMGSIEQRQEFHQGRRSIGAYQTPYGNLRLVVDTRQLHIALSEIAGEIRLAYELEIDGQWQSSNTLSIFVREDNDGD